MAPFTLIRLGHAALLWSDRRLAGVAGHQLHATLRALLEDGADPLVVDLVRVPAVDDGVVAVLAAAAAEAGYLGSALELRLTGGRRFTVRDAGQLRQALASAYPTAA